MNKMDIEKDIDAILREPMEDSRFFLFRTFILSIIMAGNLIQPIIAIKTDPMRGWTCKPSTEPAALKTTILFTYRALMTHRRKRVGREKNKQTNLPPLE
jgi:hypothetical protein